jgi:hypothetical protein
MAALSQPSAAYATTGKTGAKPTIRPDLTLNTTVNWIPSVRLALHPCNGTDVWDRSPQASCALRILQSARRHEGITLGIYDVQVLNSRPVDAGVMASCMIYVVAKCVARS